MKEHSGWPLRNAYMGRTCRQVWALLLILSFWMRRLLEEFNDQLTPVQDTNHCFGESLEPHFILGKKFYEQLASSRHLEDQCQRPTHFTLEGKASSTDSLHRTGMGSRNHSPLQRLPSSPDHPAGESKGKMHRFEG